MIPLKAALPEWVEQATCRDIENPDVFFTPGMEAAAIAICLTCPVRDLCLDRARANGEKDGVWGGVDFTGREPGCRNGHGPEHLVLRVTSTRPKCLACKRDSDRKSAARQRAYRARAKAKEAAL